MPFLSNLCASVSLCCKRLLGLVRRDRIESDMAEEMRAHLDEQTRRNLAAGMSPGEARAAAHRQFGGVAQIKEQVRDVRPLRWLDDLARDARLALRSLRKTPGFTATAVLTLALGMGVNTSMFTAIQALLRPVLPYPASQELVHLFRTSPHGQRGPHSPANFLDQRAATRDVFTGMAAFAGRSFNLSEPNHPAERVRGLQVTAEFFPSLGIPPLLGRTFEAAEDHPGRDAVVVLSHALWVNRFAADPAIVGRTLRIDSETVTVIGVMPETFRDQIAFEVGEMWRPLAFTATERENRGGNYLRSIARLRPGVTPRQAQAALDLIAARLTADHAGSNIHAGLRVVRFGESMDPRGQRMIWLTMMLAGFVLLIACANLANLQFARTLRRTHELAIRGALGAGRVRLLRQLLTESLVVAVAGGALGLVLTLLCNPLLEQQLETTSRQEISLVLDARVLAFVLAATAISGLTFGLVPAWRVSRVDVNGMLKRGSRGTTADRTQNRLQHALIAAEIALALVLLSGAGLVVNGLHRFSQRDPGWNVSRLMTGYLSLPEKAYAGDEARTRFVTRLQEKLAALPGAEAAAVGWSIPLRPYNVAMNLTIDGRPPPAPGREPLRFLNGVTPDYFSVLGLRLVAGRFFSPADDATAPPVVIINEAMARTFWPDASPLGQRLSGEEIVGVVSDAAFATDPGEPGTPYQSYRPFAQAPRNFLALAVRGTVGPTDIRRAVTEVDADLPVNELALARDVVTRAAGGMQLAGKLASAFAGLGLLLTNLGIYGVIAGYVTQRSHEIGVRMALGAQIRDVLQLVIGRGLRLTLVGTAVGLAGAWALDRALTSIAPGLEANAPLTVAAVALLLIAVALLACWLPARRAAKVDPVVALRAE